MAPLADLRAGTSGFSYKAWKGPFYPEDLADRRMLEYYAGELPAVEINNTFYRMPKQEVLEGWASRVPEDFRFSIKASRRITHMRRLKNAEEETAYLADNVRLLGDRLGAVLFQLPPYLKCDLERLQNFVAGLPEDLPAAFEFRHASWHNDEVHAVLSEKGCALCIADTGEAHDPPVVATTDWGYLRLRRAGYSEGELEQWIDRVRELSWKRALVFFKHEDAGAGPRMARRFLELAGER